MDVTQFSLTCGWYGMLLGVVSGMILGLFFHKENWLGGYGSHARRFLRLGHISFFGIGLINLFYGLSLVPMGVDEGLAWWGAYGLLVALCSMPTLCFLTAWKKLFRHLYFIPVGGAMLGVCMILFGG